MTNRACKSCRHWDAKPGEFTKTGRLKQDAMGTCRYPIQDQMFPRVPYALMRWLHRELLRWENCGTTSKDDGVSCATWTEKT
jgi:hypothetical protein